MELYLTMRLGNAAMLDEDENPDGYAIASLLRKAADRISIDGAGSITNRTLALFDDNGNRVGGVVIREAADR